MCGLSILPIPVPLACGSSPSEVAHAVAVKKGNFKNFFFIFFPQVLCQTPPTIVSVLASRCGSGARRCPSAPTATCPPPTKIPQQGWGVHSILPTALPLAPSALCDGHTATTLLKCVTLSFPFIFFFLNPPMSKILLRGALTIR